MAGYVRNLPDGRVEVYAQGSEEELESLGAELQRGAKMSFVKRVEVEEAAMDPRHAEGFTIEHGK